MLDFIYFFIPGLQHFSPGLRHLPLDAIQVSGRIRKDLGDIRALAASIDAIGLLHPLIVSTSGILLAGHRREACRLLGWEEIQVNVREMRG
jgi:ParB family chromosome partitioning protein